MPLVFVQRYAPTVTNGFGTQTVTGTLSFPGPTEIELDPALYTSAGTYVLFTYGSFNAADLANVTVDTSALVPSRNAVLNNDTANSRILLTLV